jgi:hypothetical protein
MRPLLFVGPFLSPDSPAGFGASDYFVLALLASLVLFIHVRHWLDRSLAQFARKKEFCVVVLALTPVALRLALLPHHPAPTPDVYDEFSHLLVADTLLHFRLANLPHALPQFFETFSVLQQPTYSSIYPVGQGLALALGRMLFGHPWAGVLLSTAAFCALCYWMLRAWLPPPWALIGGLFAIFEFGPLNEWTNSYWGGTLSAIAGCLVFGSLPRLRAGGRKRDAALLGVGLALQLLTGPYESILLLLSVPLFLAPLLWDQKKLRALVRPAAVAALAALPAVGLTLLQNKQVTGAWTTLPYILSRYQYGVPATLTIQPNPVPHRPLTREQELEYKAQRSFHGENADTIGSFLLRLEYRVRFYRFFFLPPLYLALFVFVVTIRDYRFVSAALTLILFALGSNLFPYFYPRYIAAVTPLFLLASVVGLQRLASLKIRNTEAGRQAASLILFFCAISFAFWYTLHLTENREFSLSLLRYETWDSVNHVNPERRIFINRQLAQLPGKKLVFVRYRPNHIFQNEWVYNAADIDHSPIVWARDLGEAEDEKLRAYYRDRTVWLLESDATPPEFTPYEAKPAFVFQDVR